MAGWLVGAGRLDGWLVGWLVFAGQLVGTLASGWLAGGAANRVVGCWLVAQRLAQRPAGRRPLGQLVRRPTGWLGDN